MVMGVYEEGKMREIKFRAWDKEKGEMLFNGLDYCYRVLQLPTNDKDYEHKGIFAPSPVEFGRFELMQYTGLKDKNGKEIYEGDILCFVGVHDPQYKNPYRPFDVFWQEEDARFSDWSPREKVEVMGNIYENGDLLEKK
jgi:hypothetical protein